MPTEVEYIEEVPTEPKEPRHRGFHLSGEDWFWIVLVGAGLYALYSYNQSQQAAAVASTASVPLSGQTQPLVATPIGGPSGQSATQMYGIS